jgi:hypothetical protein
MSAPSNLPSFDGLVRRVYELAGRQFIEGEQFDQAIGRLKSDHGVLLGPSPSTRRTQANPTDPDRPRPTALCTSVLL